MKPTILLTIILIGLTSCSNRADVDELIIGNWSLVQEFDLRTENEKSNEYNISPSRPAEKGYPMITLNKNGTYNKYPYSNVPFNSGKWKISDNKLILLEKVSFEFQENDFENQTKLGHLKKIENNYYLPITLNVRHISKEYLELGTEKIYKKYYKNNSR
ncbi:hypothetical protein BWZ20_00055 [Winogradskyella sp. J14-2]|uniref:hypothetical protein n=1 Tax=Winogradskyella sp. J14-2 TaxID=1936080 RepID=UPI0009728B4C|nr:hypothetical protein [Winogradskyella sp. J14-2]APY06786.1 hypothetical protein BWZ20_00055 [Winogradskyella sp. J14-2]